MGITRRLHAPIHTRFLSAHRMRFAHSSEEVGDEGAELVGVDGGGLVRSRVASEQLAQLVEVHHRIEASSLGSRQEEDQARTGYHRSNVSAAQSALMRE